MSKHPLDYVTPDAKPIDDSASRVRAVVGTVIVTWVIANAFVILFAAAASDGFTAMGMAVVGAVVANSAILLVGLSLSGQVARVTGRAALVSYVLLAVLLPAIAVASDFFFAGFLHRR